ncbi:AraC family ligand binding domain-containing protein [Phytohabitans sp. ZYX-F-186]|uniref:AraC family ligand binding domain-containing protein n=1 Tax=Phytohabitans maris TaxID=3071409 RepID=A0ABU0ZC71_9ACTN|nr:AraC family ligand binding domain-containing protein [Phytohabitans sp. ZYX-F-186]MDQ7904647.1 AraC family ligand binding domain-containing protein [Phytohabitans sp. ZYX-F-186]
MPVYKNGDATGRPDWVEISDTRPLTLDRDTAARIEPDDLKSLLVCVSGQLTVTHDKGRVTLNRSDWLVVPDTGALLHAVVPYIYGPAVEVLHVRGTWSAISDANVFQARHDVEVERHFHDFHEYWAIVHGSGPIETEGEWYDVHAGDLVATRMGDDHHMPAVEAAVEAVAIETEPHGLKRLGHLHRDVRSR